MCVVGGSSTCFGVNTVANGDWTFCGGSIYLAFIDSFCCRGVFLNFTSFWCFRDELKLIFLGVDNKESSFYMDSKSHGYPKILRRGVHYGTRMPVAVACTPAMGDRCRCDTIIVS